MSADPVVSERRRRRWTWRNAPTRVRVEVFVLVAAALVIAAVAVFGLPGTKDRCELFVSDLRLAVLEPTKAPDPDDRASLTQGSCSTIMTRTFDAHVLGWERHSEHTIAGRIWVERGDRRRLDGTRAAAEDDRSARVTLLPRLGPGAFLVTRTRPDASQTQELGAPPDPAGALSLPATAYWLGDDGGLLNVSATRDGATVAQSQRATARLAELVGRRPVEPVN